MGAGRGRWGWGCPPTPGLPAESERLRSPPGPAQGRGRPGTPGKAAAGPVSEGRAAGAPGLCTQVLAVGRARSPGQGERVGPGGAGQSRSAEP